MIALQLFFLYLGAALWKLTFADWRSGEMLRETLSGSSATLFAFAVARLPLPEPMWKLLTWAVIAGELLLGVLYLSRQTARYALALAACFHVSVALLLGIDEFLVCLAVAPATLPPSAVDAWLRRVTRKCRAGLGRSP